MSDEKPRQIAARVLTLHQEGAGWLEELLDQECARAGAALSPADRGLAQELAYGTVRWRDALDWIIALRTKGRTQKGALQILLRLGLYQIFWLDRIPDHAAVHETVELARRLGFGPQSGFVNAVLRGCLRERAGLERELEEMKSRLPHVGWSHPEWLCARWGGRWGAEKLQSLLQWNNSPPPTFARVNTLKTTPEALAAQFEAEGVLFTPRPFDWVPADWVFELRSHPSLATLPAFQQGLFYIQDPSTLLATGMMKPVAGESVLDLCAAPGGKTTSLAQIMQNRGRIVAEDADAARRELMRQNCGRLGAACVEIAAPPAPAEPSPELFDRILVDAPCSNTGVMRRRVDLRWRLQPSEFERMARVQLDLLARAARRLKPGGTLVYSTCSLEPEENAGVVRQFLERHVSFRVESERELLPFVERVDGAYVAALRSIA